MVKFNLASNIVTFEFMRHLKYDRNYNGMMILNFTWGEKAQPLSGPPQQQASRNNPSWTGLLTKKANQPGQEEIETEWDTG